MTSPITSSRPGHVEIVLADVVQRRQTGEWPNGKVPRWATDYAAQIGTKAGSVKFDDALERWYVRELEAALKPFAEAGAALDPRTDTGATAISVQDHDGRKHVVTYGRLRAEAPDAVLVVRRANYLLMPGLLASGEISVGVCYTEELPANSKRKVLRRPKPMLLRADSIPGRLSMEDYCSRPHAMVSFAGDLNGYIDEELALHGCKRKVVLAVPQFNGLASLLAGTDIIATVPDYAAAALAANGGVRAEPLPFQTSQDFELSMAWRGAQDNDPAERWLRSRIQMFVGDPDSP